uniref:Gastrin/cholecystokinin peptide hormone domain-containing protein n=1 Tax=Oryzias latipes TaxID=8090 RepID=A0A3P9IBD2_ORYLA
MRASTPSQLLLKVRLSCRTNSFPLCHEFTPDIFLRALLVALPEADTKSLDGAHVRHSRSTTQLKELPGAEEDGDSRANLSELLARLISTRKGSVRRNSSANNRGGVLRANHRIADRDYLGWMDFGRRSAEEYEYSS